MKKLFPILLLSACASTELPPKAPTLPTEDTCNAAKVAGLIGQNRTMLEKVLMLQPVRMIEPGMAITMDFRAERLNVMVTTKGIIERLSCG